MSLLRVDLRLQNAHEGQISVFFVIIKTVSDNEFVRDNFSCVVGNEVYFASARFVKQSNGFNAFCSLGVRISAQFTQKTSQNRKKLVTTARRSERVYKRADERSVTFCEKGGTVEQVTDFL